MSRILYIEDDPALARLVQRRLERSGFQVAIAGDGEAGVALAGEEPFAAIIVDYWLPGLDGMQVLGRIAADGAPPVVMVTGAEDVRVAVQAMKAGAADYLIKDVEGRYLDLLPSVIDRVLLRRRLEREKEEARALAQVTLNSIGDAVVTTDTAGTVTYLNPVAERLTGCSQQAGVGRPVEEVLRLLDETTREPLANPVRRALAGGEVVSLANNTLLCAVDGSEIPIADSAAPVRGRDGVILGGVLVFQDVTERRESERRLELFKRMFQNTSEAIVITDAKARIVDVNPAFSRITGYPRSAVLGENPNVMQSGRHDAEFFHAMWEGLRSVGEWQGEIWDRRRNGELYPKWLSINAVRNRHGETTHYVGIFSDITPIKETEERLHRLAHYDALTGLPNRMLFRDRLQQALFDAARRARMVAVMFIDLDRFKVINDTLGHRAGDELLASVAARLREQVRRSDTVARLGGDEFTVVLGAIDGEGDAAQVAQKVIDALAAPFLIEGQQVFTSPSIGISLYPQAGESVETLTKAADIAMYHAKKQGRNNYQFYHEDVNELTHDHLVLENDLRHALERDELEVFYQPQLDIGSGRISGIEALVRWRHAERGLLLPEVFLPLAEETGLIVAIGEWVLTTACRQVHAWSRQGYGGLRLAVNISGRQLAHGDDFVAVVERVIAGCGIDPASLELEITETHMMQNAERVAATLARLKGLGLRISIDDFGTGYSSLNYLKRFPVDTLKIDRSFIQDVARSADDAAISRAIIALARSLGLRVVAEGVEEAEQMAFLAGEQCTDAQGFFFGRPMPADALARVLAGDGVQRAQPGVGDAG